MNSCTGCNRRCCLIMAPGRDRRCRKPENSGLAVTGTSPVQATQAGLPSSAAADCLTNFAPGSNTESYRLIQHNGQSARHRALRCIHHPDGNPCRALNTFGH